MMSLEGPHFEQLADSALVVPALHEPVPATPSAAVRSHFRSSRLGVPSMSLVAPSLYVGDELAAASETRLRQQGITHVLNCTPKPNSALESERSAPADGEPPIGYLRLNLLDNSSDLPRMQSVMREGVDFIRAAIQAGGRVLVHCHRGISRSCTLAMAYMMEADQRSADHIFEMMRAARRICDPNLAYWCALQEWEKAVVVPKLLRVRSASRLSPRPRLASPSPRPLSRAG